MNPLALNHPANAGLCRFCAPRYAAGRMPPLARVDEVVNPYMTLGTHPDLVARLWDELPLKLPVDCRVVFMGTPALLHPESGIVFGFAYGTHAYALRLPEAERDAARNAGASATQKFSAGQPDVNLANVGPEWIHCKWLPGETDWCLAAFTLAAGDST
jgi:hypothetical protein